MRKRRKLTKGGRPPLPADVRKGERVLVNLTESEREALERLAGDEPLAAYLRRLILRHLGRTGG